MAEYVTIYRESANQAAIIFVHGFSGDATKTWESFPDHLIADQRLNSWDVISVGYPSSFGFDLPGLWAADPDLPLLAQGLATTLSLETFRHYQALVIIAHSMGGDRKS
ncbi:MAG: hypothetical protein EPN26_03710, partial [Rhodospirillales bacterium]